jgi:hypothetical protein
MSPGSSRGHSARSPRHDEDGHKEAREKRLRLFTIATPNALLGWGFVCVLLMLFHYMGMVFMFLAGVYHNPSPAPASVFLIPCFTTGCAIGLGIVCMVALNSRWVSLLVAPRSGIFLSFAGHVAGSVYAMLVFGTQGDFQLFGQLIASAAAIFLYLLLARRRLSYAGTVFSSGAVSVSRVRYLAFRTFMHALFLGVYTCGWCLLYTNLIDLPVEAGDGAGAGAAPGAEEAGSGLIPFTSIALPKWVSRLGEFVDFSDGFLRFLGKAYLIFNLHVVASGVKASVQLSVALAVVGTANAVLTDTPVRFKSQTAKLKTMVPRPPRSHAQTHTHTRTRAHTHTHIHGAAADLCAQS